MATSTNPPLSPQLFTLLTSIVEERAGLHYGVEDFPIFSDKVWVRLQEAGFESPLDYYYFLRYDPAGETEIANLIDTLVVGETYLFRELDALTAATESVLRPAIELRGRARVWSAGCSTGEEPATLAMLLAEVNLLSRVDIIATDVSARSLRRAAEGVLSTRSLRVLAPGHRLGPPTWITELSRRFILGRDTPQPILSRSITAAIDFRRDSLLAPAASLTDFDLILCRNVLIYFRDDVVRRVVQSLTERLRVDGRLLVGASESLLRFGTLLRCEERAGAFFYVKDQKDKVTAS